MLLILCSDGHEKTYIVSEHFNSSQNKTRTRVCQTRLHAIKKKLVFAVAGATVFFTRQFICEQTDKLRKFSY